MGGKEGRGLIPKYYYATLYNVTIKNWWH